MSRVRSPSPAPTTVGRRAVRRTRAPPPAHPHLDKGGLVLSDHPVFPILLSTDLDASRSFYRDTLGLELVREDAGDRLVFRSGGGTQLVISASTAGTVDTQTRSEERRVGQ